MGETEAVSSVVTRPRPRLAADGVLWRCVEAAAAAWLLAGCTFTFGNPDDNRQATPRERNDLYLKEQEDAARRRQGPAFDPLDSIMPNR